MARTKIDKDVETGGMVRTTAAVNGRAMTLDPLAQGPLAVTAIRPESTLPCGLRQQWIDGTGEAEDGTPVTFDLTCGAGVGSPYLILSVEGHGSEYVDMRDVMQGWIDGLLAREKEVSS